MALGFSLTPPGTLLAMARDAGLRPVELLGSHEGAAWNEAESPTFIAVLEKTA